jgi:hypothetical protein
MPISYQASLAASPRVVTIPADTVRPVSLAVRSLALDKATDNKLDLRTRGYRAPDPADTKYPIGYRIEVADSAADT